METHETERVGKDEEKESGHNAQDIVVDENFIRNEETQEPPQEEVEEELYDDEDFDQLEEEEEDADKGPSEEPSSSSSSTSAPSLTQSPSPLLLSLAGDLPSLGAPLRGARSHLLASSGDSDSDSDSEEESSGHGGGGSDGKQSLYDLLGDDDDETVDSCTGPMPRFGLPAFRRPSDSFATRPQPQPGVELDLDDPVSVQVLWHRKADQYLEELLNHLEQVHSQEEQQQSQGASGWDIVAANLDKKDFDTQVNLSISTAPMVIYCNACRRSRFPRSWLLFHFCCC